MKHFVIAILALPAIVSAAGLPPVVNDDKTIDFALDLARHKTTFEYSNTTSVDTTIQLIGVTWYERFAPKVELGLNGGRVFLSQTGNAATAGIEPDGYYAGVALRAVMLDTAPAQLALHTAYTYHRVEHDSMSQSVTLSWYQSCVQFGAIIAPVNRLRIQAGALWTAIDGQERVTGVTPRTTDFRRDDRNGGYFGLDFAVERDGYVGIEARSGAERGGEIYFKKRF